MIVSSGNFRLSLTFSKFLKSLHLLLCSKATLSHSFFFLFVHLWTLHFQVPKLFLAICYEMNVCAHPPPNSYVESLIPDVVVLGGGLWGRFYLQCGINTLVRRDRKEFSPLPHSFHHVRTQQEDGKPGSQLSPEPSRVHQNCDK